jgi:hypothetical protein
MTYFTTRIELHNATYSDYEKLHTAMQGVGFSRRIAGSDGKTYQLPTAEYVIIGNYDTNSVRATAAKAAATIGKNYAVLVTAGTDVAWEGLAAA